MRQRNINETKWNVLIISNGLSSSNDEVKRVIMFGHSFGCFSLNVPLKKFIYFKEKNTVSLLMC